MRGSTWRRWDLHVHSPASFESDFGAPHEENAWLDYADALAAAAADKGVDVVSIQDYFTTWGYDELVYRDLYDPESHLLRGDEDEYNILIIPGMEVRLRNFTSDDTALNVHLYFDPEFYVDEEDFLHELTCFKEGEQSLSARPRDLVRYGHARRNEENIDRELNIDDLNRADRYAALYRAAEEATITIEDLRHAIREFKQYHGTHRSPLLVGVAASGYGSLSDLGWDGRDGPVRRNITRLADLILSSNRGDRSFYLGMHEDAPREVLRAEIGGRKPCVWGSDAHNLETLLHPSRGDTNRFLWIKGKPTFESLRQLQFEPDSRVRIQEENPQTKAQYRTIKRLSLNENEYADCDVWFNRELTVIIGGKSTGKSFLIYGLAATMNRREAVERHPDQTTVEWYNNALAEADALVQWDDETEFAFNEDEQSSRAVSYIPQGYINRLAERPDELDKFVLGVLTEKEGFRSRREQLEQKIADKQDAVTERVQQLLNLIIEKRDLVEERREIGDEEGVEGELERLAEELERLKTRSSMSEEERERYEELKNSHEQVVASLEDTEQSLNVLETLRSKLEKNTQEFITGIDESFEHLTTLREYDVSITPTQSENIEEALSSWQESHEDEAQNVDTVLNEVIVNYREHREELEGRVNDIENELEPLEEMLALRDEVDRVEESLKVEEEKLSRLEEINESLETISSRREDLSNSIAEAHAELFSIREEWAGEIESFLLGDSEGGDRDEELKVSVRPITESADFARRLTNMLDGRRSKSESLEPLTSPGGYQFESSESHIEILETALFEATTSAEMAEMGFKEEYDVENVLVALTEDWFSIRYGLEFKGETVISMSPGQRGMVLLQFLLERSDADYPILLDQPEDNLDNRTIYDHVVEAIRDRKAERQIIVVTHDPNLVIAADAELLIVSEQASEEEREIGMDRFRYAAGALESENLSEELDPEIETVRDWVCEILEGGADAFRHRQSRYSLPPLFE